MTPEPPIKPEPIALPTSWQTHPLPEKREQLPYQQTFTAEEVDQLRRGLMPKQMEDKWFVYFLDNTLYFHRSWTGFCVYQVTLEEQDSGYAVRGVLVNRDPEQYTSSDPLRDMAMLGILINTSLLHKIGDDSAQGYLAMLQMGMGQPTAGEQGKA